VVLAADLDHEDRWPRFCAAVRTQTPVRGVLSFHLLDEPSRTALNLYSEKPHAFDSEAVSAAALFAAHARVLVIHAACADRATNLGFALNSSRQIGTAIGILMSVHKVTAERAFEMLRTASQQLHRKLHVVAEDVTLTGTLPDR
jgi:hypothetical protein